MQISDSKCISEDCEKGIKRGSFKTLRCEWLCLMKKVLIIWSEIDK